MKVEFLSAVLLVSKDAPRLARFYRDVIGVPLRDEKHGDSLPHYGCELGDLHFAIHPAENFRLKNPRPGSVRVAFEVFDMKAFVRRLRARGAKPLYEPVDAGFGLLTAVRDPDGNVMEITQLAERWYRHLRRRRREGDDILARRKKKMKGR